MNLKPLTLPAPLGFQGHNVVVTEEATTGTITPFMQL